MSDQHCGKGQKFRVCTLVEGLANEYHVTQFSLLEVPQMFDYFIKLLVVFFFR